MGVRALLVLWPVAVAAAAGPMLDEVISALERRAARFDFVEIEFDWLMCRSPMDRDPFDRQYWMTTAKSAFRYHGRMTIVRPHFRLHLQGDSPFQLGVTHTWIDGWRTTLGQYEKGKWSVYVNQNRWAIAGPIPYYTPFELALCDIQEGLVDLLRRATWRVSTSAAGHVLLECDDYDGWRIRTVLDPDEDYVPIEMSFRVDFENDKHIYWTVTTLERIPVGETFIIGEAVFVLDSSTCDGLWQIHHYKVTEARHDGKLTKASLRIEIPKRNVVYYDETRGYRYQLDASGRKIMEKQLTPQELARERQNLRQRIKLKEEALTEQERRRNAPGIIAGSALVITLVVAGGWWWTHRRSA